MGNESPTNEKIGHWNLNAWGMAFRPDGHTEDWTATLEYDGPDSFTFLSEDQDGCSKSADIPFAVIERFREMSRAWYERGKP